MHIAIVGGGWAGLSCAVRLRQHLDARHHGSQGHPAHRITVFESAPQCGGRARGLYWHDHAIDNGQHLTIGAYRETFALLRAVGARPWAQDAMIWSGMDRQVIGQRWSVPDTAWPARVLAALIPGKGPRGWPLSWRWSMARTLVRLARHRWSAPAIPVTQWLASQWVPHGLIAHFWQPLTEGALNTSIHEANTAVLARVLRDSIGGNAYATRIHQPHHNLSMDGVDPITAWCARHEVAIHTGHRVSMIHPDVEPSDAVRLTVQHAGMHSQCNADAVVIALPFHDTRRLWADSSLPITSTIARLERFAARAITTVWIELPSHHQLRCAQWPSWFVLNPIRHVPHLGQVIVMRGVVMGVVISARDARTLDHTRDSDQLREQLIAQLGMDISDMPQKWITEKSATWACTPDAPDASTSDAQGRTGVRHIFRCADDLEPGYPATIESAVRSGQRTAETILQERM